MDESNDDRVVLIWNCPVCGRFVSETSPPHEECSEAMRIDEISELRAWVEGW